MNKLEKYLNELTAKDEAKALEAASYLINSSDIELFKLLVVKTDFLFDFVRENVYKRIEKCVTKQNYRNLFLFFNIYSPYYDDLFISILSNYANEDLTDEIFEILENGTIPQKTYAAKYFSFIPDTVALEILNKYAFDSDENLSSNVAEALGQMQDDISYNIALGMLDSDDDFDKLKAVRFFTSYGKDYPFGDIVQALKTSKMPENIAGQVPYVVSIFSLIKQRKNLDEALLILDCILSGLGEILPLSDIFQFELYEIVEHLIKMNSSENEYSSKIAEILLKAYLKFNLFTENQEYIYDEDKDTKKEIISINNLLKSPDLSYWNKQKAYILNELFSSDSQRILSALQVISELKLLDAVDFIKKLLDLDDEIIVCEALTVLSSLNALNNVDIDSFIEKFSNPNIIAIIKNLRAN